jgi:hypothetical protein
MADHGPEPADRLAEDLHALGRALVVEPPRPDLASTVLERLADEPVPRGSALRRAAAGLAAGLSRGRRIVAAVVVALLLALVVVSPASARIAEWLGFGGVVVVQAPTAPALPPPDAATSPGIELTLTEAMTRVPFALVVPAELGPPDRVLITPDAEVVSMLWAGTGELPEVRLDQFAGRVDPIYIKRYHGEFRFVTVAGADDGFWLARPHPLEYVDGTGREQTAQARTSGPCLVWQRGPVTLRLEGVAGLDRAVEIAQSVH